MFNNCRAHTGRQDALYISDGLCNLVSLVHDITGNNIETRDGGRFTACIYKLKIQSSSGASSLK